MTIEFPSSVAILGAGPIGLEAALYARYLGCNVTVFEKRTVADNVLHWGHVRMFSPFEMNCSSLGLGAIAAQDAGFRSPDPNALLTGRQWAEQYLLPLSRTDLLASTVKEQTDVIAVGRWQTLKGDLPSERRADQPFHILLRNTSGHEFAHTADIVIDATGTFSNPNLLGQGGIPAIGESVLGNAIDYSIPDPWGKDRRRFENRHTLLVGGGYSAASTAVTLAELSLTAPETRLTWVLRQSTSRVDGCPMVRIVEDQLGERDRLAQTANQFAASDLVNCWNNTMVHSLARDQPDGDFNVELKGDHAGMYQFDNIVANVGYHPNNQIFAELQVPTCYVSDGPIKLAASLLQSSSANCLDQITHGIDALKNPEPNFFVLGSKSYGRNSKFLVSLGLEQIRETFASLAGRSDLDIYSSLT